MYSIYNGKLRTKNMNIPQVKKISSIGEEIVRSLESLRMEKDHMKKVDFNNVTYKDLLPHKTNGDVTEKFLREIMGVILLYIHKTFDRNNKILDFHHPHQFLDGIEGFDLELPEDPQPLDQLLVDCRDTLKYGVKTGHPRFFNQLSSGLDIVSLAADWVTSAANTNMFTFEIAPVFTLMEDVTLKRMRSIIGWEDGDGIFSPGGSINNLYSVMMARQMYFPQVKREGMAACPQLVMFSSKHAHYSNKRPACVLGLGMNNAALVDVDNKGRMKPSDLERRIIEAKRDGKRPFYVTATAGTTVLGAFDPIVEISHICKKHNLWLHVDAAWGGGVLMSKTHRHLIKGVELADSVTWNPHKMLGVVLQCSTLLTRHKGLLSSCNSMHASYLFQQDKNYDISYDTGDKTIQCGRHVDVFKFWLAWKAKGDKGFRQQVDKNMELAHYLTQKIKNQQGFQLVMDKPSYVNICFWYYPRNIRNLNDENLKKEKLEKVAPYVKGRMMDCGMTMIGYQPLDEHVNFFRFVVSNPAARREDIDFLLNEIKRLGEEMYA